MPPRSDCKPHYNGALRVHGLPGHHMDAQPPAELSVVVLWPRRGQRLFIPIRSNSPGGVHPHCEARVQGPGAEH